MFLRVIGRYSCSALQNVWTSDIRNALEAMTTDKNAGVREVSE